MDMVFLSAAQVRGAKAQKENASELILYNLNLHARLIYLASTMKLERCAFMSSSYVYPHTGKPNTEEEGFQDNPPGPVNYGLGWVCRYLETLCKYFAMTSKTKYAIVRPTAYYGPHDRFDAEESHVIPALIVKAVNRMDPFEVWGTGEDVRCFTYIDDLVDGLLLTMEKYANAEALNICTAEVSSVKQVLPILFGHTGFHPRIVFNPAKPSMIPYKVSSPTRAEKILGWKAHTSLPEGLKKTIDWYRGSIAAKGVQQ
jgi:GDP-L-fucose synthase